MDETINRAVEALQTCPELSFDVPNILIKLNEGPIPLGELAEDIDELQRGIELVERNSYATQAVLSKLRGLPAKPVPNLVPIGF